MGRHEVYPTDREHQRGSIFLFNIFQTRRLARPSSNKKVVSVGKWIFNFLSLVRAITALPALLSPRCLQRGAETTNSRGGSRYAIEFQNLVLSPFSRFVPYFAQSDLSIKTYLFGITTPSLVIAILSDVNLGVAANQWSRSSRPVLSSKWTIFMLLPSLSWHVPLQTSLNPHILT